MGARSIPVQAPKLTSSVNKGNSSHISQFLKRAKTLTLPYSVTHWGTSPKFLAALKQASMGTRADLPDLEITISAGSPLSEDISTWFARAFPPQVGLLSGSGGTDLVASSQFFRQLVWLLER